MSGNNNKTVNVKMSMELVQHLQEYLNQVDLSGDNHIEIEEESNNDYWRSQENWQRNYP